MHILPQPADLSWRLFVVVCLVTVPLVGETASIDEITRQSVVREINLYRIDYGLEPLSADERLHLAAEDRIRDMEQLGYWGHEPPDGGSPFVWLKERAYLHRTAGENLAAGYETAKVLVQSWMESPGHRANILSPAFVDVGVAWIEGGTTHRLTGRSVVVLFAREMEPGVATAPVD